MYPAAKESTAAAAHHMPWQQPVLVSVLAAIQSADIYRWHWCTWFGRLAIVVTAVSERVSYWTSLVVGTFQPPPTLR